MCSCVTLAAELLDVRVPANEQLVLLRLMNQLQLTGNMLSRSISSSDVCDIVCESDGRGVVGTREVEFGYLQVYRPNQLEFDLETDCLRNWVPPPLVNTFGGRELCFGRTMSLPDNRQIVLSQLVSLGNAVRPYTVRDNSA